MSPSLTEVSYWMTLYLMTGYLILGLVGNSINIFMFTRKNHLHNSCTLYLFTASIVNIFTASWGVIPAVYSLNHVDPSQYSFIYCKLRIYVIHTCQMIGRTCIVLACIDRYMLCLNSLRLRPFYQPKVAIRIIIAVLLFWPCINTYIPFLETFTGSKCIMTNLAALVWGIYTVLVPGLLMPTSMSIFGVLAIRHRRQLQTRLHSTRRGANSKRDYALMVMLLSEVLVYVISTCPFPVVTLYQALTRGEIKSAQRQQIENFVSFLSNSFLIYLNPSAAFYTYIAASQSYRNECMRTFMRLCKRVTGRRNQVGPMAVNADATRYNNTIV